MGFFLMAILIAPLPLLLAMASWGMLAYRRPVRIGEGINPGIARQRQPRR
jgi:hypothetical protein